MSMLADIGVNPFRNFGAEARGAFGRAGPVAEGGGHGIAQIFEPPRRLLFRGSYNDARSTARVQNKWLLINIQRDDVFESHVLNRDVWKDGLVAVSPWLDGSKGGTPEYLMVLTPRALSHQQEVIESSFVFWQAPYQAPEAMQYMSRHQVAQSALPHIGVLDPRTQRLLWSHTGGIHKDMLTEKRTCLAYQPATCPVSDPRSGLLVSSLTVACGCAVTDLCSRIKWDDASTLPPPPMQNTAPQVPLPREHHALIPPQPPTDLAALTPGRCMACFRQVYDKSYDEQLALAIAASLKEQKEEVVVLDDDEEEEEEEDSDVQMLQSSKSLASRDSDVQVRGVCVCGS
jgi:hypothetical protein